MSDKWRWLDQHPVPHLIVSDSGEPLAANVAMLQMITGDGNLSEKLWPKASYRKRMIARLEDMVIRGGGSFRALTMLLPGRKMMRYTLLPCSDGTRIVMVREVDKEGYRLQSIRRELLRNRTMLKLSHMEFEGKSEMFNFVLENMLSVTDSDYGYIFDYDDSTGQLRLIAYTSSVYHDCGVEDIPQKYNITRTGMWTESIRKKGAFIINQPPEGRDRLPRGHVAIQRLLSVPIIVDGHPVGVAGVANKEASYDHVDAMNLQLLVDGVWDIVKRKEVEEALSTSERRYRMLVDGMKDLVIGLDDSKRAMFANPSLHRFLGVEGGDLIGQTIHAYVHPDDVEKAYRVFNSDEKEGIELRMRTPEGWKIVSWESDRMSHGPFGDAVAIGHDITERRRFEEELRHSLEEKTTLLQEVHHRVKNNMQIVNSLLSLQMFHEQDPKAVSTLQDASNRIMAIASVHEGLYQSESVSALDAQGHLLRLCQGLAHNLAPCMNLSITVNAKNVSLDMGLAIPISLVINELVTNSIKYAFPDGNGSINVTLSKMPDGMRLEVSDNGIGLPDDFNQTASSNIGTRLVRSIVIRQLGGSVNLRSSPHSRWTIKFPYP